MIKEMYNNYKIELSKKNNILMLVLVVLIIGLIFGSIYITILSTEQKTNVLNEVTSYFKNIQKISFDDKIIIFKNSLLSNLIYVVSMWLLGISIIGIPIVFIMIFFKSFIAGFSVSSIFSKYGFKGIIKCVLYVFPSNILMILFIIFLSIYSILISSRISKTVIKKENINFKSFMGRYLFILVIGILVCILCAAYDAFIEPMIYGLVL